MGRKIRIHLNGGKMNLSFSKWRKGWVAAGEKAKERHGKGKK